MEQAITVLLAHNKAVALGEAASAMVLALGAAWLLWPDSQGLCSGLYAASMPGCDIVMLRYRLVRFRMPYT